MSLFRNLERLRQILSHQSASMCESMQALLSIWAAAESLEQNAVESLQQSNLVAVANEGKSLAICSGYWNVNRALGRKLILHPFSYRLTR
jgi:hypothetical protein